MSRFFDATRTIAYDSEFQFAREFGERVESTDSGVTTIGYWYYGRFYLTEIHTTDNERTQDTEE